ncbi:MAG TPA: hypothetical protein VFX50_03625 [Gemmatimonadales bacterium]|nr:hypothetical protein [Gemmatimonadales bacterium]
MPRRRPVDHFEAELPVHVERDWLAVAVSTLVHLVVILVLALLTKRATEAAAARPAEAPPDTREVAMIYLPPPEAPAPLPVPQPVEPPPPQPVQPPSPRELNPRTEAEPNAPPEARPQEGRETPNAVESQPSGEPDAPDDTGPVETPEGVSLEVTMESEAKRIFGRKRGAPVEDAGPLATRPLENAKIPDNPCGEIPVDSTGAPITGVVEGVVRDQDSNRPLAGAHLQMVGQPYSTFANNRGAFRLTFDITLMADCRTQYVRIMAPGFRSQMLPIVIGGGTSTVALRRK